jgi:flagellar protein FlaG
MALDIQSLTNDPRITHGRGVTTGAPARPEPRERPAKEQPAFDLEAALTSIELSISNFNKRFKFSINQEIDRVVVKVIDTTTDKVIKVIPSEEMQRLIAHIKEAVGLLVDEEI